MMASFEYSTTALISWAAATARCRLATSWTAVITSRTSPVSMWDTLMFTGNSLPFAWRPLSSSSTPLERVRGSAK